MLRPGADCENFNATVETKEVKMELRQG